MLAQSELATWNQAVALSNEFLGSRQRHALPAGTISIDDEGMVFTHGDGSNKIVIECTSFGDVLVGCNMMAQERSWGFVVGRTKPGKNRLTDNSFFRDRNGDFLSNITVAQIILHELTHTYYKTGIDHPWNAIRYYAEACFLFRYRKHSMEKLPYQTSGEFYAFINNLRKTHPERFSVVTPKPSS